MTGTLTRPNCLQVRVSSSSSNASSGSAVLYYSPDGGRYYHADRNCKSVNPIFLPLQGSFSPEELEDEAYKDLMPCNICGAPLRP